MLVPLTLLDFLERGATCYGQRTIIDEPGAGSLGTITYAQLDAFARSLACALDDLGLPKGARVAIVSPNSARYLVAMFGVSAFGRVLVPVNYRLQPNEVDYIVRHSGAALVLADGETASRLQRESSAAAEQQAAALPSSTGAQCQPRVVLLGPETDGQLFLRPPHASTPRHTVADENDLVSINYTSGTTARPKGVRLTHRSVWLQAAVLGWHAAISDRDVYLHTLPLFHVNGWGASYALTAVGARQVVMRKVDGEEVLRRVKAHGVTLLCGAPSVVSIVLDAAAERQKKRCGGQQQQQQSPPVSDRRGGGPRVRMIVAGAPPPSSLIAKLETVLGWEFCQLYGLTETSPMLTFNRRRQEWDGLPPGRRAKLLALAGAPALGVRLAVSADGELLARSNHVFDGYHNQPEETARAIAGGWFHSGDGGRVVEVTEGGSDAVAASAEASGRASSCEAAAGRPAGGSAAWPSTTGGCAYVEVTDRKKDVIITGGENVSSIEVEECLYFHPAVAEAAVVGLPHDKWGETVVAVVVLRTAAGGSSSSSGGGGGGGNAAVSAQQLIGHCRARLAHYKCPTQVFFTDALARTATGKVQKFLLRRQLLLYSGAAAGASADQRQNGGSSPEAAARSAILSSAPSRSKL